MTKYRVVANEDLRVGIGKHTWTKGLDYEVVEKEDYFTLASNESQLNYENSVKDAVMENFTK